MKIDKNLDKLIKRILKDGLKVYTASYSSDRENEEKTYIYFTDGTNIGYAQSGYFGGIEFCTVHKPNKSCGTGFKVEFRSVAHYTDAFNRPNWAWNYTCEKWPSWEKFAEKQHATMVEITKELIK